jgi:hypothetical protein
MYTLQLNTLKSICMYVYMCVFMFVCLCVCGGRRNSDKLMNEHMILGIVVTLLVPSSTEMMSGKLFLQDVCLI